MTPFEYVIYYLAIILLVYMVVITVFSPFILWRLVVGRWPLDWMNYEVPVDD